MRPETQKQIVKAFAMMYEDTEMPLSELIEKLQQLNGGQQQKKNENIRNIISDEQILNVMLAGKPETTGTIKSRLKTSLSRESLRGKLTNLVKLEKVIKTQIHPRLIHWTKL